jgi:hypothetical protein
MRLAILDRGHSLRTKALFALIAKTNGCEWCMKAHSAVADAAYRDGKKVSTVLSDLETSAIEEPLRTTLRMLCKLTREHAVDAGDIRAVLAAVPRANRSRMRLRCVSRSTRSVGWRMPSGSSCPVQGLRGWREVSARARLPVTLKELIVVTETTTSPPALSENSTTSGGTRPRPRKTSHEIACSARLRGTSFKSALPGQANRKSCLEWSGERR